MKNILIGLNFFAYIVGLDGIADGQDYKGKRWVEPVNFSYQEFKKVSFEEDTFNLKAEFYSATFNSDPKFTSASFNSTCILRYAHFVSKVDFNHTDFYSLADFLDADFDTLSVFEKTFFHSFADFSSANFRYLADFNQAEFHSKVDFVGTQFGSSADFSYAIFDSIAFFKSVILPDTLFLSNVSIKNELDLTSAKLNSTKHRKCKIDLLDTDINKVKFNYDLFELYFQETEEHRAATYEQKISIYEKLRKRFDELGFKESYKNLDIEYQDFINTNAKDKSKEAELGFKLRKYLLNPWEKYWWNYGYNKEWVIFWSVFLLIIFTLINVPFVTYLNKNVYQINTKAFYDISTCKNYRKNFNVQRISKILFNSLVYTAILFFGIKLVIENFKNPKPGGIFYLILIYVIGLFCLGYLLNIIITKV